MKMTLQIIIGLIVLGLVVGFVIKNQHDKKTNKNQPENKVLLVNGKPILKQFEDLTPKDFVDYPIWVQCHIIDYEEKWYDETDEETFRPWVGNISVSPAYAMFLVKANLITSDGDIFTGFLTPCLKSNYKHENYLGFIQPQIFTKTGERFGFWTGMFPKEKSNIDQFYKLMGKSTDQIFPIIFKAETGLSSGVTSGKINGFLTKGENNSVLITK